MKVYCVTLDGVIYDVYSTWDRAYERCKELQGETTPVRHEDRYMVETWEVEE